MNEQLVFQIALTKIPYVGVKTARNLISYCGDIESIFKQKRGRLLRVPGVGHKTARAIECCDPYDLADQDIRYLSQKNIKSVFFLDPDFPIRLKQLDDAPVLLFYRGDPKWNHPRTMAVVGTRRPNSYGKSLCRRMIEDLKPCSLQVISGLAYGIDSVAHNACVVADMETLAVMGTGIDNIYPAENKGLANKIVNGGALVTEYPIHTRADKENFPRRNRIIAGLADVTVVVQSAIKGGSMITAHFANNYHREVACFPGRTTDESFSGCNHLIKKHRAHMIESASDLMYLMGWNTENDKLEKSQPTLFEALSDAEMEIVRILRQKGQLHIDHLQSLSQLHPGELSASLLNLEFKGSVRALPGKSYAINC